MRLTVATSNRHKFEEFLRMMPSSISLSWLKVSYLEPQDDDLETVAVTSALWLSRHVDDPFFLEDAGLFIDALGGFPGSASSLVFARLGNEGILKLMDGIEDRRAKFVSVIALNLGGEIHTFVAEVPGIISDEPRGGGWGFDPIFIPDTSGGLTYGELGKRKDRHSHRGLAVRKMLTFLERRGLISDWRK